MVSRTYTVRELLRMRQVFTDKDLYNKLFEKLRKDRDLGEIFRMSSERSLPLIVEEEMLDKTADDASAAQESSVRQLDGTDAEWKYRGRTESEHGEHQPIGAPAGLSAQKDEGFQRFYKAVVSPTHVRVTAGGRIVPNTRGSSSPTAKWAKEKPGGDGSNLQRPAGHLYGSMSGIPVPATLTHPSFGPFPPLFPGFVPSMQPGVAPGPAPPFAMMPWQMGLSMGASYAMVQTNPSQVHQPKPSVKAPTTSGTGEKEDYSANPETSSSLRVSPPEHFDHNRPFFFNGQWVMPPGGSFYPYGVGPIPGFPISGVGGPAIMPSRFALPPMMHPTPTKLDQAMHAQVASSSSAPSVAGQSPVPISSIRPSDITRKQIEVLKSSLRYFEDQLQYNKHQIDEKAMESQADMIRQQIQQFEKNLKAQLESEQAHYVVPEQQKHHAGLTPQHEGKESACSTANDVRSEGDSSQSFTSHGMLVHPQPGKPQKALEPLGPQLSSALRQVKSASAPASAKITPESSEGNEPIKKSSTLPVSAALAPPFHPRADSAASVPVPPTNLRVSSRCSTEDSGFSAVAEVPTASLESAGSLEKPYLVGRLPDASRQESTTTGYLYSRELTEDELRARHMYWGKAPRHLQKGLPKFDGKDFYPPSPQKRHSSMYTTDAAVSLPAIPSVDAGPNHSLAAPVANIDPFHSLEIPSQRPLRNVMGAATQSENLSGSDQLSESGFQGQHGVSLSCGSAGRSYEDFRKALQSNTSLSPDGGKEKSSDEGDEGSNILFRGRKYMATNGKNRHEIWQRVWKRNKASATAVPGTVSSMTAKGVLPNYAGHATASLAPAIAHSSSSPKGSSSKPTPVADFSTPNARHDKTGNRPIIAVGAKEAS